MTTATINPHGLAAFPMELAGRARVICRHVDCWEPATNLVTGQAMGEQWTAIDQCIWGTATVVCDRHVPEGAAK